MISSETEVIQRGNSLPDEVARRLRAAIESGELKPGDRLPTQQELCTTYGVSRPVVREAVSLLKSEGLVISQQGRGQFVNPEGTSVFRLEPRFDDREDLAQVFEFLVSVEVAASEMAAARRTEAELKEIRQRLRALEEAVRASRSGVDEDMEFHRAILRATHNAYFMGFGDFLESRVRKLIRAARTNTARHAGLVEHVQQEHVAIFDAIERQDVEAARHAAGRHLRNAADRLRLYREQA